MIQSLALKYRPSSFDSVIGQRLTAVVLAQMVKRGEVPQGLLFKGPRGTGKTSAARILAMELNPTERDSIMDGTSLSVIEIDAASNGSVADIRALMANVQHSVGTNARVVILDEAHSITREGFNALLKTLEEPPAGVYFVLVTTEPEKVPDTVVSRLIEFEFRRVSPVDVLERVIEVAGLEGIALDNDLAIKLAEDADGSVRDALNALDLVSRAEITTAEQYVELVGEKDIGPLLFATLLTNDHATIFHILDKLMLEVGDPRVVQASLVALITDLFVLKSGGRIKAAGQAYDYRVKLQNAVSSAALYSAIVILWELKTKIREPDDQRSGLEMALILVAEKVSAGKTSSVPDPVTPVKSESLPVASETSVRTLSLSEIMQQ